jgi:hypothetical protein
MSPFPHIAAVFLDTVLAGLIPWFLIAAGENEPAAREAAIAMLASYNVETEQEIRLAAEIASHSFAVLHALGKSVNPDLSLSAMLRLRGSANASQRSKNQCQRTLDKLRKERLTESTPAAAPADTVVSTQNQPLFPAKTQPEPDYALSRPQRRAVERALVKAQRKQAEKDRLKAVRAHRTAGTTTARQPEIGQSATA